MTHTPGPWKIINTPDDPDFGSEIKGVNGQAIGSLYFSLPEAEANENLIASAPELLEALKRLSEYSKKVIMYPKGSEGYDPTDIMNLEGGMNNAIKAINKAEGKQ